jgi:hypothetical protein
MSDYSLSLDIVKIHQEELAREVEMTRNARILRRNRKPVSLAKKLRAFLTTVI